MILTMENYVYTQRINVEENNPKFRNIYFGVLKGLLPSPYLHFYLLHIFQNFFNKYITFVKKVNFKIYNSNEKERTTDAFNNMDESHRLKV